jgi:hypothetical protein
MSAENDLVEKMYELLAAGVVANIEMLPPHCTESAELQSHTGPRTNPVISTTYARHELSLFDHPYPL